MAPATDGERAAMARASLLGSLVADIYAGLTVLRDRDGVVVSDEQLMDRARNIVAGLIGNYSIESIDVPVRLVPTDEDFKREGRIR